MKARPTNNKQTNCPPFSTFVFVGKKRKKKKDYSVTLYDYFKGKKKNPKVNMTM